MGWNFAGNCFTLLSAMDTDPTTPATTHYEAPLQTCRRALLVGVYFSTKEKQLCEEHLIELTRLCETYGLLKVGELLCPLKKRDAAHYIGSGKVEELRQLAQELEADVIIFDDEISPHQQRNLEKLIAKPVIDRTELIIEVFAQRAQTREARLQIELAKVRYQVPRLKRLWTHLSRQTSGGGGFTKGEGEKQIELDRRMLKTRLERLKKELAEVAQHRKMQRQARLRSGIPTLAIVGYTNAGKSTLLNALTQAGVLAEDKLFATLDTTTRKFSLPNKQEVLLVDTVGFIRKIPHTLVAAFRSTLEEVLHTDLLLHLIDVSNPVAEEQAHESFAVLKELKADNKPMLTVLNKADACTDEGRLNRMRLSFPRCVVMSALTGQGMDDLATAIVNELARLRKRLKLRIPQSHYALVSELMREGKVYSCDYEGEDVLLDAEIPAKLEHKVEQFEVK